MSDRHPMPLLIFPCNGNGLEALDCLGDAWHCVGFVDDRADKQGRSAFGIPVFPRAALEEMPEARVLAVPGSPVSFGVRRQIIEGLRIAAERFAQVIHPSACISPRAGVGRNVLIMAGVVLTSNAVVGSHVCLLPNTVVHHDAGIGDWTLIGSNVTIAGHASIGRCCYIGSGSSVMNDIAIGEGVLVGMGTNVIQDVPARTRVVGNPARPLAMRSHSA
jgi:sugar O-acyltransferase (sialic acid O-acetyltransferase NeuD family)